MPSYRGLAGGSCLPEESRKNRIDDAEMKPRSVSLDRFREFHQLEGADVADGEGGVALALEVVRVAVVGRGFAEQCGHAVCARLVFDRMQQRRADAAPAMLRIDDQPRDAYGLALTPPPDCPDRQPAMMSDHHPPSAIHVANDGFFVFIDEEQRRAGPHRLGIRALGEEHDIGGVDHNRIANVAIRYERTNAHFVPPVPKCEGSLHPRCELSKLTYFAPLNILSLGVLTTSSVLDVVEESLEQIAHAIEIFAVCVA